jgi:hypothetical protein
LDLYPNAILKLKYRLASSVELEREISALKQHLGDLEKMKEFELQNRS